MIKLIRDLLIGSVITIVAIFVIAAFGVSVYVAANIMLGVNIAMMLLGLGYQKYKRDHQVLSSQAERQPARP